ncbi:MAG: phytanoyl-CoA dioxygenase family protein [FCB group bacterium]|jgi:ectoine hydroxylase-related dioxygenase (phytanoyl-CoA dioxygenase family)|nr:phytanoyl-CoA dioxygenase family protein [FCB group bacterium]
MNAYPLTEQQIAFYRENGFVQLPDVLTPEELADVRASMDALIESRREAHDRERSDYSRIFLQMVNLWRSDDGIRRFALNRKLGEIARQLSGVPRIRLWHDHALVKMPGDSRETPWHQDLVYWPMNEDGALSCWMALDDVDEQNGCMQFIPGSHRLGRLEPINLVDPQDIFALAGTREISMGQAVAAPMNAGSCTFHDGRTFHFATANHSDRPRRAMVVIYMADGTTYNGNRHVVTDGQGFEVGAPLAGDLFPIVGEG